MQTGGDPNDPDHQSRKATCQNMSTLEQDLKKQILGRSKAEKTFRPWWDTLEDYLLNSLVLLGKWKPKLFYRGPCIVLFLGLRKSSVIQIV